MSISNDAVKRAGEAFNKYIALYSRHKALEIVFQEAKSVQVTGYEAAKLAYEKLATKIQHEQSSAMSQASNARGAAETELDKEVLQAQIEYDDAKAETEAWQAEVKEKEGILVGIPDAAPVSGGRTSLGRSM